MERKTIPINGTVHERGNARDNPIQDDDLPPEIRKYLYSKRENYHREPDLIDKLEGRHIIRLILFINSMSPVIKTDIHMHVSRCNKINSKLDDLMSLGLIKMFQTAHTNTHVVVITEKGRRLATVIQDAISICEEPEDHNNADSDSINNDA